MRNILSLTGWALLAPIVAASCGGRESDATQAVESAISAPVVVSLDHNRNRLLDTLAQVKGACGPAMSPEPPHSGNPAP